MVVTGASGGIGRATARLFAQRGDTVALLARGERGLDGARRDTESVGGTAATYVVDTADAAAVDKAADQIEEELGEIDIWVNVAFTSVFARFVDIEPEEFERVTQVTYLGFVNGTRSALRRMLPRDRGTIVQVGSTLAYRGIPLQSAYCGAKHATQGFHESLRTELLHDRSRVRVTMVQMPAVNTPQFSWVLSRLPRQAQPVPPDLPARGRGTRRRVRGRPSRRREYWVGETTAATLLVNAVAPGLLDRYLARTGFGGQQTDQPKRAGPADQPVGPRRRRRGPRLRCPWTVRPEVARALAAGLGLPTPWHARRGRSRLGRRRSGVPAGGPSVRSAIRARLVLGILCVAMPHRVLAAIGGRDRDDPRAAVIARVLGARLLVQAGVDAALGPRTRRVDVAVELTHAASMLPAALIWPTHRRSALVSAACGGGVALLDLGRTSGALLGEQ